ncbi:50S ribosomal protein L3 [Methylophilales bacterium MBRSG12]|uniref:Large ribosomal subunit protein uL3 n=1 Tax=Methylophilales bacterium MBRS-H7 TaxID=1623450 RepID=A0A0H4IXB6_9PROT|nr:50S ribosomal protein L3 [Methylophilales bacterium MBRSF5]AKO65616.1 50S ribosomal protein L3 [Methylophilales bacterium MBRS-H7]AKO66936.1 50S ribosomal protein L3 [Methylophilales bacterium MBRSG12]
MSLGLVGRKVGMTRLFTEDGNSVPVTVLEVVPNKVTQIKKIDDNGYNGLQVSYGDSKSSKLNKSIKGHLAKAGVDSIDGFKEFRVTGDELNNFQLGGELKVSIFEAGQKVDITGTTIGKGFQGGIKRHHFGSQRATHGNSISHNAPGSTGMCQDPGRVFKGKKMAGHMGAVTRTTQNLEVIRVDENRNLIMIKGAVPGSAGSNVTIKPAVKAKETK